MIRVLARNVFLRMVAAVLLTVTMPGVVGSAAEAATDFYVDTDNPQASDESPGTREEPWKTIGHAAGMVKAGDSVHVMPGTYPESVSWNTDGTTLIADGAGPAIIDGSYHLTSADFQPSGSEGVFYWEAPGGLPTIGAGAPPEAVAWVYHEGLRLVLRHGNPWLIAPEDILDWKAFCARISEAGGRETPSVAKTIWSSLSELAQNAVREEASAKGDEERRKQIATELSQRLASWSFEEGKDFRQGDLPEDGGDLVAYQREKGLGASGMQKLNRLVLQFALPDVIRGKLSPLDPAADQMCFCRDRTRILVHEEGDAPHWQNRDRVYVNINGKDIPDGMTLDVSAREGFSTKGSNVRLKGFVFNQQVGTAIAMEGSDDVAEDCLIIQPAFYGLAPGRQTTFRRIRIDDATSWAVNLYGRGHVMEECVLQTCGRRLEPAAEIWIGVLKFNGGSFHTIRHNLLIDRGPSKWQVGPQVVDKSNQFAFGGIWGDITCMDNKIYGNCISRIAHAGIYVEYTMNRSLIAYNTIQDCSMGITFRQASHNVVRNNWIFDSEAIGAGPVDTDNFPGEGHPGVDHPYWGREMLDGICIWQTFSHPPSAGNFITRNLVQTCGRSVSIPVPTDLDEEAIQGAARIMCLPDASVLRNQVAAKADYRKAWDSYLNPLNNFLDGNYYVPKPKTKYGAGFALYLGKQFETLEDFREATGLELTGREGHFTPADIGLSICWTMPPDTDNPGRAVAFDYDGGAERAAPERVNAGGRDEFPEPYSWKATTGALVDTTLGRVDVRRWAQWPACRTGLRALAVSNLDPQKAADMPAEGAGWRTFSVPVTPGTEMEVSTYLKATDIRPQVKGEGVEAFVYFCDWTGHGATKVWLVGSGERPELAQGSYDWTRVAKTVRVPEGARRMMVYVGLKPAVGSLFLDDLRMNLRGF